jgi:hypothetical protein
MTHVAVFTANLGLDPHIYIEITTNHLSIFIPIKFSSRNFV